jgi:hypothetical protein
LPDVKAAFARYTLLKLYTDNVPLNYYPLDQLGTLTIDRQEEDAQTNKKFQVERFNTAELPLYVVIEPTETGRPLLGGHHPRQGGVPELSQGQRRIAMTALPAKKL